MKLSQFKSPKDRREFLEKKLNVSLKKISQAFVDEEKDVHCENLIGETTLPLGVAGPLLISYDKKIKEYYLPLATTEGALVASVNRGCKAIYLSDGAKIIIEDNGITRGPVFETENLKESFALKKFIEENFSLIKKEAEKTSSHLKLLRYEAKIIGHLVYLRFFYDTNLAMGMNMATIATQAIVNLIEEKASAKCIAVAGNFDLDKKPSWLNFYSPRGLSGWGEIFISNHLLKSVLKTTKEKVYQVWLDKNLQGSIVSGSLGFNGHFANIVAAFFAATGQDLAHVVEGSLGMSTAKTDENGLYFSIYLPSIVLGMIGGGTKLSTKKEAIEITQAKNKKELAAILVGGVLAGELSLLASLAEGTLACSHQRLGR